ncbi:TolC family protein [Opitutus terrae]|uniref:Outer membrane efflux protein n=1 Tax=Opitutus terrae (strain DSM 11246 / JCM 15787 / PB90-1) TaxID=452637 RepID=B1ZYA2_OPITP|nr:TolC family protein [Opitutus terrae]ACB76248.1 outer membrane efflux protein [Opitutus terrae PB90-1]
MNLAVFSSRRFKLPLVLPLLLQLASCAVATAAAPAPITVDALVAEIAASNPELRFYEAEVQSAKAAARGSGALADPDLTVELGRKRVREATGVLAGEGAAWSVSVTQTFEWPGRLALRKAIAGREVELAELGLQRFRAALDARARVLAHGLHAANTKVGAVREVADRFAALKETFLAREPAGIAPQLETRVIEANELTLQRRASDAELELQAALLELNQLRGAAAGTPLMVTAPPLEFGEAPEADVLLAAARENNFEFRMRRAELEQQDFEVRLARHERYPAISVSPFYSTERAGERETMLGVGVSVPLPVGGRTRSAVGLAEARRRQAEAAALVAERELERAVLTAAQTFAVKTAEARRWPPEALRHFREAAELADRHYRLGAVPISTYVELQASYLEAVEALLDTQREALAAGLKLRELAGLDAPIREVAQ